jgi:hypothetical protein
MNIMVTINGFLYVKGYSKLIRGDLLTRTNEWCIIEVLLMGGSDDIR